FVDRIRWLLADKGYDAEHLRSYCDRYRIRRRRRSSASSSVSVAEIRYSAKSGGLLQSFLGFMATKCSGHDRALSELSYS
ncbi:hypothetical protein E0H95_15985, partial [Pseudomonas syringae pv. tomato]|nr:hypothetical protein [Pseudomonas syringae pv. tomato]